MQVMDSSKKSQPKILNNIYEKLVKLGEGSGGKVYLCKVMSRNQPKSHSQFFFTNTKLDATNQADSLKLNQETSGQEGKHYLAIKQFKNASCLDKNEGLSPDLINEIKLMKRLSHPNVMAVRDIFIKEVHYAMQVV